MVVRIMCVRGGGYRSRICGSAEEGVSMGSGDRPKKNGDKKGGAGLVVGWREGRGVCVCGGARPRSAAVSATGPGLWGPGLRGPGGGRVHLQFYATICIFFWDEIWYDKKHMMIR